ncbi:secretin N-terminal domain-containing protein [Ideonella sp. BN130291]|uniref:secretin N-terminal domain-containing protein n=1 Tax=Ideonella sp. BN130291 TaxID=3112940 RepID=UPI002E272659|nr:secretin N-terminal domain-containing protein [Ideonella sp. BN130291]
MNASAAVHAPRFAGAARAAVVMALVGLLFGCAEQRVRDESRQLIAAGDYERAVRVLEAGLKDAPESPLLRGGLIQARAEAVARIVSVAAEQRSAGKLDEAQKLLQRAQGLDPQNERLDALLRDLDTERRQSGALAEAEQWLAKKRPDVALRTVEQALKDNPRHGGLLALQRRLELDQRQSVLKTSQAALAETRPISLDFRDASLRTVLDVVSRNSGVNFVLDKDIRPDTRITVYLRQARVEDALDLIVSTNQLAKKVMDAHTIVVYPNTPEKQREYQEQIVRVFYLASAEAKGAATFLKSMLKLREPFVDERSNMLALRESPENIQLAERLIALYDAGEPEVLLEVEVMEVSATRLTELGVKYPDSFSLTPLAPSGASGLTVSNLNHLGWDRVGVGVSGLLINLKREVGDFKTLANPKIRARNKEKAKVMIGDKIPVITTTTAQAGFVSDSVNYLDVGIKLDVEPTVYADDEVAIKIALEVSSLGTAVKTSSGTLAYQIGTRNASTLLRLHDGETQLLAGLISRDDRTSSSRVPGVGDLPVLGRLFSSQQDNSQRTELVLAITPRILRNIRRPDANESELWVGTEAVPKLRPVGGLRAVAETGAAAPAAGTAPAVPATAAQLSAEPPKQEAPAAAVRLAWSGPADAKVGQDVELQLLLNSTAALRGLPVELGFSVDKLQLLDVTEGDYFKRDGSPTSFSKSGEGQGGKVNAGVLRNQATGASGDGTVLRLRFKTLAPGTGEVRLQGVQPIALGAPGPAPQLPAPWTLQIR